MTLFTITENAGGRGRLWQPTSHGGASGMWPEHLTNLVRDAQTSNPLYGLSARVNGALNRISDINATYEQASAGGTLTADGLRETVAEAARQRLPEVYTQLANEIRSVEGGIEQRRQRLDSSSIEPGDFAAAVRRDSVRSTLAGMKPGERKGALLASDDLTLLEAVLEIPESVSDLKGADRRTLMDRRADLRFPGERDQLAEMESALATALILLEGIEVAAANVWKMSRDQALAALSGQARNAA